MKDIKSDPYRNLLVAAANELIKGNHISLDLLDKDQDKEGGHIFLKLFGHDSVIIWSCRNYSELFISVWWKYDHNKNPRANLKWNSKENFNLPQPLAEKKHYRKFVGVTASCWLERKNGKFIQGKNRQGVCDVYTRKGESEHLKNISTQTPRGYENSGHFYGF